MLQIIARIFIQPLFWLLYWPKPKNWSYMFQKGPVIYMSNHKRWFDPVMIVLLSLRPVYTIGKQELFNNKFYNFFLRKLMAFPVGRGSADLTALKRSINILKSGKVLLIFPEGTRTHGKDLNQLHDGVSFIASKTKAMIVPINIQNDYSFFHTAKVSIGKPIDIQKLEEENGTLKMEQISSVLFESMRELHQGD